MEVFRLSDAGSAIYEPLLCAARALCREYYKSLIAQGVPIDDFQAFSKEIDSLPSDFIPPRGGLWLALHPANETGGPAPSSTAASADAYAESYIVHLGCRGAYRVVGIVALRDLGGGRGEVKRLYVREQSRRLGAATALSGELERFAKACGYTEVVLDTLARLKAANALYARLNFQLCEDYNGNPMSDAIFMKKLLL